jgi:hypothetical protein
MNLHFLPVESVSSTCGIMPEDWIILNFFCILIPWNWFMWLDSPVACCILISTLQWTVLYYLWIRIL